MAKSLKKKKIEPIDGFGPTDVERVRKAIRQVWNWSYPRRKAKARCMNAEKFFVCEQCGKVTPTIQVHHINTVGDLDEGFLRRLFCPSEQLICLCPKCHREETKKERAK